MQKLNSKLLQKVSTKKTSTKDSIFFTLSTFAALTTLLYLLCYTLTLIDKITL